MKPKLFLYLSLILTGCLQVSAAESGESEKGKASDRLLQLKAEYKNELKRTDLVARGFEEKLARKDQEITELKAVVEALALQLEQIETLLYLDQRYKVKPPVVQPRVKSVLLENSAK